MDRIYQPSRGHEQNAIYAIQDLEKQIKSLTIQLERSKEKQKMFMELSTQRNRELKRLRAHSEWLQKRYNDLLDYMKKNGINPPF